MDRWEGKVAIVTGASGGIGGAIAELLAKAGVRVVGLARNLEKLEELAANLDGAKGKFYYKQCDLNKEEDIVNVFEWVETELGGIDILVNNAAYHGYSKIINDKNEDLRRILNVNVLAMAIATKIAVASMKRRDVPGHIININSIVGHENHSGKFHTSLYPASKHAVTALTESVRQELATEENNKIKITSLSPSFVKTGLLKTSGFPGADELLEKIDSLDPLDIANGVIYVLGTPENVLVSELTIRPTRDIL